MNVWLVILERGGIFGVYFTRKRAEKVARNVNGVYVMLPIIGDFR